jgi:hypothetical protein
MTDLPELIMEVPIDGGTPGLTCKVFAPAAHEAPDDYIFVTRGISTGALGMDISDYDLSVRIKTSTDSGQLENLAQKLCRMLETESFEPDVWEFPVPIDFPGVVEWFDSAWVLRDETGLASQLEADGSRAIYRIIPMTAATFDAIDRLCDLEILMLDVFRYSGIYDRAIDVGEDILEIAMSSLWQEILDWHVEHKTVVARNWQQQSAEKIEENEAELTAMEQRLGFSIPWDLRAFMKITNQELELTSYSTFPISTMETHWTDIGQANRHSSYEDPARLFPFMVDSGYNFYCLDLDRPYCIIARERHTPSERLDIIGFWHYILRYFDELKDGTWKVDEEGFLSKY